jgi:CheY-like chemotaxis protein
MPDETKTNRVVMVVDDDQVCRSMYRELLESEGCTVYVASNGREALDIIATKPHPHLIFLDLFLPVMSAPEFLQALRADSSIAAIPVVVLSPIGVEPSSIGASRALYMPITCEAILGMVTEYCGS